MMLTLGGLLTSAALLMLAACAVTFRRPDAPRWTTRAWVHEVATIGFASLLAIGLGYLAAGGMRAYLEGPPLIDLGLLAGVLVVATMIWRRLDVRARLRTYEAAARVAMRPPAIAGAPGASPMPAQLEMTARADPPPPMPRDRAA